VKITGGKPEEGERGDVVVDEYAQVLQLAFAEKQ
jgi:hypothetical protein